MKHKRRIISVMMILCLLLSCTTLPSFAASGNYVRVSATQSYSDAQKVLKIINSKRAKKGLARLTLDQSLTKSAVRRAAELMIYVPETSPHRRPNGKLTKSINSKIIYECSAEGYPTPKEAVEGWWTSPVHKKGILLGNARSVGIGCITSKNGLKYWTLEFSSSGAGKVEKRRSKASVTYKIPALSKYLKKSNFFIAQKDYSGGIMKPDWAELYVGETANFFPAYRNNINFDTQLRASDITWKSSNKSVAEVSSKGKVTCKKKGKFVLYAKMKNSPGYTLKCTFTVVEDDFEYDSYYY